MKKLLIIMLSLSLAIGASAQYKHVVVVGGYGYRPYYGTYVGVGYPYPYPYYPYYGYDRPTKLDLKIEDIKNEYKEKIWAAKHDQGLPHKERRANVRALKNERDAAILDARRNFYRR